MEQLRAVALATFALACAVPVGYGMTRWTRGTLGPTERLFVAWALGLGAIAYALTLVGLAGGFWPPVVIAVPAMLALAALAATRGQRAARMGSPRRRAAPALRSGVTAIYAALAALGACVLVSGLAPPTDYDGLLYHLVAPRAYLEHGSFVYLPHNFSANLPMFGEQLFAVGLAGGSDRAPQLIHAGAGVISVGLTWALARRVLPGQGAHWAAAAVAGTPLVPFLATRAYIDLFTVAFATAAMVLIVVWMQGGNRHALLMAGLLLGFAISSKYAALIVALPAGVMVVLSQARRQPWKAAGSGAVLASAALVAALPWTLRQTVVLGNPLWPMYLGGRDWDAARVEQLTYFVSQYGSGASPRDWLLLPLNIFRESWRFGHVPWSFPPLVALAAPLAVLDRRRETRWLAALAAMAAVLWARGWQDLRFLLAVYPVLAVLGVAGARAAMREPWGERAAAAVVGISLAVTVAREGGRALERLPVALGVESESTFLERAVTNAGALRYLNERADPASSVLFLGEGQIWYCRARCIPDPAHDNLLVFFLGGAPESRIDLPATVARLQREGVQHVLLSKKDFWYLEHQDPEDRLRRQLADFYVFKAAYLDLVYEDDLVEVYRTRW